MAARDMAARDMAARDMAAVDSIAVEQGQAPGSQAGMVPAVAEPPSGSVATTIEKVKQADRAREGFPGEHWLVLGLGVAVWQVTRRDRHWLVRTAGALAASMLAARAASGRDGLAKVLRYTPLGGRISRCPPCGTQAATRRR